MNGNAVSYGHQDLIEWADRREALGAPASGPLSRVAMGSVVAAGARPGGTHGDPTMANQLRDEYVYQCERAVQALMELDEDMGGAIWNWYVRGNDSERRLSEAMGVSRRRSRDLLTSAQAWVGSRLMRQRAGRKSQNVGVRNVS